MHLRWKLAVINASLCHVLLRQTRVDAKQHDEATRVAEEAVSGWQEGPRVYRWDINTRQYQCSFIYWVIVSCYLKPLREVVGDEMLALEN